MSHFNVLFWLTNPPIHTCAQIHVSQKSSWTYKTNFKADARVRLHFIVCRSVFCLAGTPGHLVDKHYIGNFAGQLFSRQGILGAAVAGADPGLVGKPGMRIEGACASGGLAFTAAVDSVSP
jgi:acetyl-CoA acetyltransferase